MRLMHLSSFKPGDNNKKMDNLSEINDKNNIISDFKSGSINQIKNITQEKKSTLKTQKEIKAEDKILINSFNQLLEVCIDKKEMKLKYELENNINLVSFEKNKIEISFNDNLDKNFVKDLSLKLYEWTSERWIITFSKTKGDISMKEKEIFEKNKLFEKAQNTDLYKLILKNLPDAKLFDVVKKKDEK